MTAALFDLPRPHVRWFDTGLPWPCWEWCRCGVRVAHEGGKGPETHVMGPRSDAHVAEDSLDVREVESRRGAKS